MGKNLISVPLEMTQELNSYTRDYLNFHALRVDGNFRVLKNEYRGVSFYQLEIDAESEFFNDLKARVEELCGRDNVIIGGPNSFDPYKPDRADWETNVSAKIDSSIMSGPDIPIWKLTYGSDKPKRKKLKSMI